MEFKLRMREYAGQKQVVFVGMGNSSQVPAVFLVEVLGKNVRNRQAGE